MIEITLAQVSAGIGEIEVPDGTPRMWKLLAIDQQSGITVGMLFDRAFVDKLHADTKVEGVDILVPEKPRLARVGRNSDLAG